MRRLLSILLLAAFALPLIAPLLALGQDLDASLPACCRRHGQHHCAMGNEEKDPSAHRLVPVCMAWPQRAVPASVVSHYFVKAVSASGVLLRATGFCATTPEFYPRLLSERLHPKRGPPVRLLA